MTDTCYIVEHTWQAERWHETRPVYRTSEEALEVAERMAEEIPRRSKIRVGYRTRVRTVAGEVVATYRDVDNEGFGQPKMVAFAAEGDMREELRRRAERDGVSIGEEAKDVLGVALGLWTEGEVADDE